ncbi:signal transduction histidine kinase [Thermodesulfovibrio aggregans]|uniref:histidine kinase n=1 Tax=Thermodesulfovibrio aggregans TaxID=86166 RepID=A0A0U9HNF1_9BACT|nr:ATP-binding protein [Thermodesulfovibrio aggregans]GAQ94576.1 signal transduction histidine kinase [Thermodesulfovibrio aggregans]
MAKFNLNIKWLFVLTMIILFTGITLTNYFFSLHLAEKNLNHHTETVALLFKSETERLINPVENFLYNVQALVCCKILNFNDIVKTNKFFMDFIKKYPYVTSINYGDGKGNGYLILNDRGKWLNRIKKAEYRQYVLWHTLNSDGEIIEKKIVKDNYDPRNTIWYKQALQSNDIYWSKEYTFRTTKDPGITASLLLCSDLKEVVGIDVMIKNLSLFLSKAKQKLHPEAKLYLISENEDLIAFSNEITPEPGKIYKLDKNIFPLLYHAIESEKNESFYKISFNNQKWFVKIENFNIRNRNLSLVTLLPQTVITKSLYLHLFYQIFASLILTFIVLIYITNRYINPLIEIARETSNLGFKEIYFDKFVRRKDEIGHLSKAISDASVKILEARVMERQLEELHYFESIKRSLGEAVHRFKDLINIIQGFATLAQPKVSNEFAKNALDQIINASKRAIYLSKEILSVTGERKYEMKVVDLNSILLSMKSKLETSASKSIQIVYEILDSSLPVKLDIEAFDEVLMNLITNAHDAMPEGGKLTIKTKIASFLNKKFAVLYVSDTGIGMDEETKKRIFEPFFTTKGAKGTGLGLSIVYRIIKDHEGFIEVESEIGKGTTFKIYLPISEGNS